MLPRRIAWIAFAGVLSLPGTHAAGEPAPLPAQPAETPWPTEAWAEALPDGNSAAVEAAAETLFSFSGRGGHSDTRALLVIQRGAVVFERYADGFHAESRFRSWSAAKSVTQALAARLALLGRLRVDDPAPVPEWQGPSDPRKAITIRHLLHMNTGLDNADGGDESASFVAKLLFGRDGRDSAGFAAQARLLHEPGRHWAYSTGTSQLLSRVIAREVGGGRAGMIAFARQQLAQPLGIRSLVLEFDPSGTPIGGGYVWMSARDWARLGLLYLRDGVWDGRRLLPEGWVDFTRTPAPADNNRVYGAHFWINAEPAPGQFSVLRPGVGGFQMNGNAGQFVVMFPSRDLIVVRLGEMHTITWSGIGAELANIAEAFPEISP